MNELCMTVETTHISFQAEWLSCKTPQFVIHSRKIQLKYNKWKRHNSVCSKYVHQQFFSTVLFFFFASLSYSLFTVLSGGLKIETNMWLFWRKKETHIVNQYSDWIISRVLCHHWIYIFFMINGGIAEWLKKKIYQRSDLQYSLHPKNTMYSHSHNFRNVIHLRVWRKWADYVVIPLFRLLQNSIE